MPIENQPGQERKMSQEELTAVLVQLLNKSSAEDVRSALSKVENNKSEQSVKVVAENTPEFLLEHEGTSAGRIAEYEKDTAEINAKIEIGWDLSTPGGRIQKYGKESASSWKKIKELLNGENGLYKNTEAYRYARNNGLNIPVNQNTWEEEIQAPVKKNIGEWKLLDAVPKTEREAEKWEKTAKEMDEMHRRIKDGVEQAKQAVKMVKEKE